LLFPAATLLIFLSVAAFHFGKEDTQFLINKKSYIIQLLYLLKGLLIILAPLFFHFDDTVKIFNYVVSLHEGQQPFYLSSNSGWSSIYDKRGAKDGKLIYLEPISLSKLFQKNNLTIIDILKIDIEGAEYDILLNDKFLENYHVKELIVEVDREPRDKRYSFSQLIDYLQKIYRKVKINNSESEYPLIHCKNYQIKLKDNKISGKK